MMKAQGATEYLVLLAVVLIVALVSVALLGFFPGMASDAQITQSQAYWKGASPIAITEMAARVRPDSPSRTVFYIRMMNSGAYPVRITQLLGDGQNLSTFWVAGVVPISQYYYLAPGEETYFGTNVDAYGGFPSLPLDRYIDFMQKGTGNSNGYDLYTADSLCQNTNPPSGTLSTKVFGFEYIEYIEGQQITKRQVGKPLVIKCS